MKLLAWMEKNKESVIGTTDFEDWTVISNVPLTRTEGFICDHLLKDFEGQVVIEKIDKPAFIILLGNSKEICSFTYKKGKLSVTVPENYREYVDDVLKISFIVE